MGKKTDRLATQAWIKGLRQYEQSLESIDEYLEKRVINKDGIAVIPVNYCQDDIFDPYGQRDKYELSKGFFEYIEKKTYLITVTYPVTIFITNDQLSEYQQDCIEKEIKTYFSLKFQDKVIDLKINNFKIFRLVVIGLGLLALSLLVNQITDIVFIREFLSIAATFSLWEAVDHYLVEKRRIKIEKLNAAQLGMAEVRFQFDRAYSLDNG